MANLITNGDFATNVTGWTGGTWSSGSIRKTRAAAGYEYASQTVSGFTIGALYFVRTSRKASSGNFNCYISIAGVATAGCNYNSDYGMVFKPTATSHTLELGLYPGAGANGDWVEWDDVYCDLASLSANQFVVGGAFTTNDGFSPTAHANIVSGRLRATRESATNVYENSTQFIYGLTVGTVYTVTYDVPNISSASGQNFYVGINSITSDIHSTTGSYSFSFTATATTHQMEVGIFPSGGAQFDYVDFDNISMTGPAVTRRAPRSCSYS